MGLWNIADRSQITLMESEVKPSSFVKPVVTITDSKVVTGQPQTRAQKPIWGK